MARKFNPSFSFDGVAIIFGIILAAVAWGSLNARVSGIERSINDHDGRLKTLGDRQDEIAKDIAVLKQHVKDYHHD